jgi:hypothetical protein
MDDDNAKMTAGIRRERELDDSMLQRSNSSDPARIDPVRDPVSQPPGLSPPPASAEPCTCAMPEEEPDKASNQGRNARVVPAAWVLPLRDRAPKPGTIAACNSAEEIFSLFQNWIAETSSAIAENSGRIAAVDACPLIAHINRALDSVEEACDRRNERFPDVLSLLYPLEDLLVFLRLALAPKTSANPSKPSTVDDNTQPTPEKGQ